MRWKTLKVYIVGVEAGSQKGLLASPYMEKELRVLGYDVEKFPSRDIGSLNRSFQACAQSEALILCPLTGNLSVDAACVHAAAQASQKELIESEEVARHLAKRGKLSQEQIEELALMPEGARIFPCHRSLIPGFEVAGDEFHIVVLPSNPEEQTSLFFSYLFQILNKTSPTPCYSRVLRIMEMGFEQAQEVLQDLTSKELPCVAIYEKRSELIIRISDNDSNRQKAAERCNEAMRAIVQRLGTHVYGIDVNGIEHALALKCAKKNIRIAFAESGSAGLAAKRFHNVDKDEKLIYSVYQCQPEKMDLEKIGINDKIGKTFGPVSANVTAAMALGASKQEEKDTLGLGLSLPNAAFKSRKAYVAAVLNGVCMMQELDAGNYHSLTQMTSDAVAKLFNLARKLVDSYPQAPEGSCDAEEAVLEGMGVVPQTAALSLAENNLMEPDNHKKKGRKTAKEKNLPQEVKKAPKGFKGILYRIFPNRDDSGFDKVRKILMWICVCVFMGSMIYLIDFGAQNRKSQANLASLQDEMAQAEKDIADGKVNVSNIEGYPNDYLPKFYSFYQRNEDIKGWIKIDDTNVNFPVVQTSDNDYYHRLGFDKEYDYYGTPYIDYECDVKTPSTNIIIYGHNIRNDGQMFNDLTKYKQLSFYKEHPTVSFDSVYKEGTYKIIGAFITNTEASHDNGNVFEYNHFVNAETEEEFNEFIDEVRRRSIFDTPVDVEYGDELLTLSTCTYEFKEARFVVVARRVRDGEDASVDVDQAVVNEDAYYPAVYADAAEYAKKLGQVKSITIDGKRELTMNVGDTTTLTAKVSPSDAAIQSCTWDSSNKAVVTVDKNTGLITAVGAGTAQITAVADDGGYVDNITITVKGSGKELTGITLDSSSVSLKPEEIKTLTATLQPEGAQASLTWKSSDDSIVHVSGNETKAEIKGINAGSAEITVASSDGKYSATCKVTVTASGADENNPSIVFAQSKLSLTVGQPQNIKLSVAPANADIGTVSFSSSSDAISVQNGYSNTDVIVTAQKAGEAVLTATTSTGLQASCTITVKEEGSGETTDKAKLSVNQLVLNPGEEAQLQYSVDPAGTEIVWSSSNPRIADVDQNGYVTTIISLDQTTEVTITMATKDGSASTQTTVTVMGTSGGSSSGSNNNGNNNQNNNNQNNNNQNGNQGAQSDLGLEAKGASVEVGYDKWLDIYVDRPEGEVTVVCSSSDRSIARVDNNGIVTGVGEGTATITITATDNNTGEYQTVTVPVTVTGGGYGYGTNDPVPDEGEDDSNSSQTGGFGTRE